MTANWAAGSAIRMLWDKYPAKQAWMPNQSYSVKPVMDEIYQARVTDYANYVKIKTTGANDGFYFYMNSKSVEFSYKTNGQYNGSQR